MNNSQANIAMMYFVVLAAAGALYIVTGAPGTLWQDSGMIQYRVWHNDIEGKLGLALAHPLFYLLAIGAKYIPLGEFAHRVNLVSACAGALAIANLFLLMRLWLGSTCCRDYFQRLHWLFLIHSGSMPPWPRHIRYTMHCCLPRLIMLLQYVKTGRVKYLYWLGFFNGLAVADHMLGSIAFACYAVFILSLLIKRQMRLGQVSAIAGIMDYRGIALRIFDCPSR